MAENFKSYGTEDLQYELESAQVKYQKLRFDHTTLGLENPKILTEVRRDIARIKTELRGREIAAMNADQLAARTKLRKRRRDGR